jgi:hypothetical protein
MKIKTIPAFYNQSLTTLDQKTIKFDNTGTCEVSEKIGLELLDRYPEFVFSGDVKEKANISVQEEVNQNLVDRLKEEIMFLKEQNSSLKKEKETVEADLKSWQDLVEGSNQKVVLAEKALEDHKKSNEQEIQTLKLKISLLVSSVDALKNLCEKSGYEKSEWTNLSKEKLIDYILNKS